MGEILLTKNLLDEMLFCKKTITKQPRKDFIVENGNKSNSFIMESLDTEEAWQYNVFIKQNQKFNENFSIGLRVINSPCGNITLLRCNGPHGPTRNGKYNYEHHRYSHVHLITLDDIKNGKTAKPSYHEISNEFYDLDSGILYFCKRCNIIDYNKCFDFKKQVDFFAELSGD